MRREALAIVTLLLAGCTKREHETAPPPDAAMVATDASSAHSANSVSNPNSASSSPEAFVPPSIAPSAAALPVSEWVWKTYRGDRFTAAFPGDPKLKVLPAEDDRVGYTEASVDVPGGRVSFAAGFSDYPQADVTKPEAFLDEKANAPRRGLTDVLTKRSITLPGGHPGRVLILRRNISGTPLRVYSRLHLVGRRLYSLIVSTLDDGGIGEDVVKKFMESFKPT